MFSIIKKHKPIVLNCYTDDYLIYEHFQIKKSSSFIPDWWKSLPNDYNDDDGLNFKCQSKATIKHCPGFVELFKKSFTFPMPTDLYMSSEEQHERSSNISYCNNNEYEEDKSQQPPSYSFESTIPEFVRSHHPRQFNYAFRPGFSHIKLKDSWLLQTKENIDWIIVPAFWNLEKKVSDIFIPPGIDNYKYQHSTTWQLFIKTDGKPVFLEAGEPLLYMIPKTDRKVIVRSHYDPDEVKKLREKSKNPFIINGYYKKIKKLYKKEK